MKRIGRIGGGPVGRAAVAGAGIVRPTGPGAIAGLVELSGTGATVGHRISTTASSWRSRKSTPRRHSRPQDRVHVDRHADRSPADRQGLAQKAVDQGAYVVMGPVFSGSIIVSMAETRRAEIPNFTGGEAASITQQGNPYIFRTSFTQATAMPKVARYIKDSRQGEDRWPMMWVNNDFGKGGRDAIAKALEAQGIKVAADISTDPRPGRLLRARCSRRSSRTPTRCSSTPTRKNRRARCASCSKQGYDKPIIGETTLTGQKVIELRRRRGQRRDRARRA